MDEKPCHFCEAEGGSCGGVAEKDVNALNETLPEYAERQCSADDSSNKRECYATM